ncbi:MAG: DUF4156 domain-containing protein [Deltaproteobacteria bacterium]|nr:DUF4156 domain-containing protein [Deltaproteobacteria bacterium]
MKCWWLTPSILILSILSGCSTTTKVTKLGFSDPISPEHCEVRIMEKANPPKVSCETLGKIETHVQRNLFFGGRASLKDAYDELRSKACELGGNIVTIDDYIESSASEFSHVHIWASVLKASQ